MSAVSDVPGLDATLVRADNPGPYTLQGTNTWLLGRDPCWVVDPGPDLDGHVEAVLAEGARRGGIGGVALTHDHADHAGALPAVVAAAGTPVVVAAAHPAATVRPGDGERIGPLIVLPVPGHAPDHLCFGAGPACCTGDAVLGRGSVFVADDPGALRGYLDGLARLRAEGFALLLPGHGPLVIDAAARLDAYVAHRLDRERRLLAALDAGARTVDELLAAAWADAPPELRAAATLTLAAHLGKLEEDGRLPPGVERPSRPVRPRPGP